MLGLVACAVTEDVRRARCVNARDIVHVVREMAGVVRMG